MHQTSQRFEQQVLSDSRTFRPEIRLLGESIGAEIRSMKYYAGSNAGDSITLGSAVSAYVEVTLYKPDMILQDKELEILLGLEIDNTVEWVPLGYFTAQKPQGDGEDSVVTAYDRMKKLERPYFSKLAYPSDTNTMLKEISRFTGVPVKLPSRSVSFPQKPEGYTCREVVSYIAQMLGCFAIINRDGKLELKWYKGIDYPLGTDRYWAPFDRTESDYSLNKLECSVGHEEGEDGTQEKKLTIGGGVRGIAFANPYMTKEVLGQVYEGVKGFQFRPGNVTAFGDPRIEPGDVLTVSDGGKDYQLPVMSLTIEWDGGLSMDIEAVGDPETEESFNTKGPTAKMLDRVYTELFLVDKVLANKVEADYIEAHYVRAETFGGLKADFETTKTRYLEFESAAGQDLTLIHGTITKLDGDFADFKRVTTGNIDAVNGNITAISGELSSYKTQVAGQLITLDADIAKLKAKDTEIANALIGKASISDLDALRTRTQTLESDVADINTLVNGNLTSENIHSLVITGDKVTMENGFVKNAMIESLAFDKITGVDINTTRMTVHSEDGKSTWTDNTLQIADADRVRVQIGKDASGDYNIYIWDKNGSLMFDPLYGVQESGIKKPIIRNDMVSDNAQIAGHKLDIEDVIKEVNGATTVISSTRVKLDSQGQTLDVAFGSLKTYAEGVNSRTESNETAISVAQGKINTLISNTTIVKDGKTVQLKDAYNSTVADVNSIKTTINEHTSLIDRQSGEILAVQTKANTIESDLNGTKQTVSAVQSELNSTKSRVATVEMGLDGIKARVSTVETAITKKADGATVDSLKSRVATCEATLDGFEASLTAVNKAVSDNYASLDNKIGGIQIGGTNLLHKTRDMSGYGISSNVTLSKDSEGFTVASFASVSTLAWNSVRVIPIQFSAVRGKTVTVSLEVRSADYVQLNAEQKQGLNISFNLCGVSSVVRTKYKAITKYTEDLSEDWKKITVTATLSDEFFSEGTGTIDDTTRFFLQVYNYSIYRMEIRKIKLEVGTKATGWSPAPEDIETALDLTNTTIATHTEQISRHDTRITAAESAISLKVSTTDFTSYQNTVTGNINTAKNSAISAAAADATAKADKALGDAKAYANAQITTVNEHLSTTEQEISIMKGQIALKVSQTDIDTAVQGIQIGGRNILLSSATKKISAYEDAEITHETGVAVSEWGAKDAIRAYGTSGMVDLFATLGGTSVSPSVDGEIYTHSIYVKNQSTDTLKITNNGLSGVYIMKAGEVKRVVLKGTGNGNRYLQFVFRTASAGGAFDFIYWHPKIELGNKATDWSPAPEDTDAAIAAVDSKFASYSTTAQIDAAINLAKDSIVSTVSQTYATKSEVSMANSKINSLEVWKTEAAQKITKDGIVATVGDYYAYKSDLAAAETRITSVETKATQTANKFNWIVKSGTSATDFTLTDRIAQLITEELTIKDSTGASTIISGGKMDIDKIFANNITATGTIQGVRLIGATGSFSGDVNADSFTLNGAKLKTEDKAFNFIEVSDAGDTMGVVYAGNMFVIESTRGLCVEGTTRLNRASVGTMYVDGKASFTNTVHVANDVRARDFKTWSGDSLKDMTADTGWVNISPYSDYFEKYSSTSPLKYRKIGKLVQIQGIVKPVIKLESSSSVFRICTIPTKCSPKHTVYKLCQGTGSNKWLLSISSDGTVGLSRYGASSYVDVSTSAWLPFSAMFFAG